MPDLDLTVCMADYDKTAALRDGTVRPAGIDLKYVVSPPSETFWRMLRFDEFPVSEMSWSSFLIARARGRAWTALPVFPYRAFFHTFVFVSAESDIRRPQDLAGKRFGVPEYQMTAAVWVRGVLQHEFGVPPSAIRWFVERETALSHGGQTGFTPPHGVSVEAAPAGAALFELLTAGELDAVMPSPYGGMTSMLNRTNLFHLARSPVVRRLFDDSVGEGTRYFRKNGFSHINHVVIVQNRLLDEHPWIALNLVKAFEMSKRVAYDRIGALLRSSLVFALDHFESERSVFGDDPYPYGLRANRTALQTLADYNAEQGLIPARVDVTELFAPSTRDS